jgi:hypothetical protein
MQKIRLNKIIAPVLSLSLIFLFTPGYVSGEDNLLKGSYSYDKDGWRFVHIEGKPYQRGFQLGYILAPGIDGYRTYLAHRYVSEDEDFEECWERLRNEAMIYWDKVPKEYKAEMRGIAKGAEVKGYNTDYKDILVLNSHRDLDYKRKFEQAIEGQEIRKEQHCSAFITNGSYTKDGDIVIAHNTWTSYSEAKYLYYLIHVKPKDGYEFLIQTGPGMIWSTTGWCFNSAGLVVAETALGFDGNGPGIALYHDSGVPIFVRARKAIQYSDNIDDLVKTVRVNNNGACAQDWLIGDAKTNEIAILELGLYNSCLRRTMDGFYGSCNYVWDEGVASEWLNVEPVEHPSVYRLKRWKQLSQIHQGNIDIELAKGFLGDHFDIETGMEDITAGRHILCGHQDLREDNPNPKGTIDGKVTSGEEALEMKCFAIRGHPCGVGFDCERFLEEHPEYKDEFDLEDMPSYSWTVIAPQLLIPSEI